MKAGRAFPATPAAGSLTASMAGAWTSLWAERLREAWAELREQPGRTALQALGVTLGVASILGGFALSDSLRRQSERYQLRMGGMDLLHVYPQPVAHSGPPSALQTANPGLRAGDAAAGAALDSQGVAGVSLSRMDGVQVRSPFALRRSQVTGIGADFIPMAGYALARGRGFAAAELEAGAPVAILGSGAAQRFFPGADPLGQVLDLGGRPVTVVGTFQARVFRFGKDQPNALGWQNRIIALPAAFVQRRLQADPHQRVDELSFRLPEPSRMVAFARDLATLLQARHRSQIDFRLDDVGARFRRQQRQGRVYDLVFLLSGVLAMLGAGIVNVNIHLASLRERVREVGLKLALGASAPEVFLGFMTEAMLLTLLGILAGLAGGLGFAWILTRCLGMPLFLRPGSFLWAGVMAFGFGFGFALVPAWKACRLSPMEALRYE